MSNYTELNEYLVEIKKEKDERLLPENIKKDISIMGIKGTFTSDATATAEDILKDQTAYVDGEKITGTFEVPEPNLQDKTVEITENGTTTIRADEEFDGLDNVEIITSVSGGGTTPDWIAKIRMFNNAYCATTESEIDFTGINTTNITNYASMFYNAKNLKYLDLSMFDGTNAQTVNMMFQGCTGLEEINLENFYTPNLTACSYLFTDCKALKKLNIRNIYFNKVTNSSNYTRTFYNIPTTVEIITNQSAASWIANRFPSYQNFTIVKADWE